MCHFPEPDEEIPLFPTPNTLDVVSQPSMACANKIMLLTSSLSTSLACPMFKNLGLKSFYSEVADSKTSIHPRNSPPTSSSATLIASEYGGHDIHRN